MLPLINEKVLAYVIARRLKKKKLFFWSPFLLTTMTFDPKTYHDTHWTLSNHISSLNVLDGTIWQHGKSGLELIDENNELPVKLVTVGRVSAYRLKCGPAGNHIANGMSPLEKAKYQFHISRPAHHDLAEDYQAGISTLEALQSQVATTKHRGSMIVEDVTGKMIRFIKNVFTLRVSAHVKQGT